MSRIVQVLQDGADPSPKRRVDGTAFAEQERFDPSKGEPCGVCAVCQENTRQAREAAQFRDFGFQIIGSPTRCSRLVEYEMEQARARARAEQEARRW